MVPDKPSRRNSNLISGSGNQVYIFNEIGLNLSNNKAPNINKETENDRSAAFMVMNVVNLSFSNEEMVFKNIATISGIKTTASKIYSMTNLSKTLIYLLKLFLVS